MSLHVIDTAIEINNKFNLKTIPYHALTRKDNAEYIPLDKLDNLLIQVDKTINPYKELQIVDRLKIEYQSLCNTHIKSILKEKNYKYIYVSMNHLFNFIKKTYIDFHFYELHRQFFYILQLIECNDVVTVKSVIINDKEEFIHHQYLARSFEQQFNLKYNIKEYVKCQFCIPTLCSLTIYHKDINGKFPSKKRDVDKNFNKALILIKNDRIDMQRISQLALIKFKCTNYVDYFKKMEQVCTKCKWDFNMIIESIHKMHYNILKLYESMIDIKFTTTNTWKNNSYSSRSNSPSWR